MTDADDQTREARLDAAEQAMDDREAVASARIEEADVASRFALTALSEFMREIVATRRLLASDITPARALSEARDALQRDRQ
jgi:hypothetical protein